MPNRIRRDRALPLDLFADEAVYELELRQIWQRDWVFATPADAVAEAGDHVPTTIGEQPVLIVRGDDLQVRAFANVCSHRGAPLVECSGSAARFPCPYHGWTYGRDGALQSVPYTLPDEVDAAELGLREFRCEVWHGLVFVCLSDDVEPLAERLAVIDPYVRPLALTRLHHHLAGQQQQTWQANWKIVQANGVDSYSTFRVHADTIESVSPTDGAYYLAGSAAASATGGESFERADHVVIAVPPSFVAVVHSDALVWQALTPSAVDRTIVRLGSASERPPHATAAVAVGWPDGYHEEDRQICERLQRNARSRTEPGPLLGLERAVGDFHDYLRWRLTDRLPDAPFVAARPGERPEAV